MSKRDDILWLADEVHDVAGVIKLGLQAFVANGPALVKEVVSRTLRVFLDLKLHDIPHTVQNASREAEALGVFMLSVHTSGGKAMLRAAASDGLLVLGVTVLTSLDETDLQEIGFGQPAASLAVRLAVLAQESGLRGVVTSPLEIRAVRERCGPDLIIVAPGIRSAVDDKGDQRRTLTAQEAIRAGASYIVVGRPITAATNRREAALRIIEAI